MRHKLLGVLLALGLAVGCSSSPAGPATTSPNPLDIEPTVLSPEEVHVEVVKIALANSGWPWVLDDETLDSLITLSCELAETSDDAVQFVTLLTLAHEDAAGGFSLDNLVGLAGASLGSRCPEQGLRLGLG